MGKKAKKNRNKFKSEKKAVITPSFESPVCPACGRANQLTEEIGTDDTPLYECTGCWVRFMVEDSRVEIEEDDDDVEANINMGSVAARDFNHGEWVCEICYGKDGKGRDGLPCLACKKGKKKKDDKDYQTEPMFGEVEELTDAVSKR